MAKRMAGMIRKADPERVTVNWPVSQRTGKVFIDFNMNRRAASLAVAYSVRPEPGATDSMPLSWAEVEGDSIRPADFTIRNFRAAGRRG